MKSFKEFVKQAENLKKELKVVKDKVTDLVDELSEIEEVSRDALESLEYVVQTLSGIC